MRYGARLRDISALLVAALMAGACVTVAPLSTGDPSQLPAFSFGITTPLPSAAATRTQSPTATPTATPTPTPTLTPTPTPTPTEPPTAKPPTEPPVDTPTPTDSGPPPSTEALDFTATPNYGTMELVSGYEPDPFSKDLTAGGTIDVSYLGDVCNGYATKAPDFELTYTSGNQSLLRFYFVGSGDATLVVNDPLADWHCGDDSFGTINPTVDFASPGSGTYDIWIGSYASGSFPTGTLYITELPGNHP